MKMNVHLKHTETFTCKAVFCEPQLRPAGFDHKHGLIMVSPRTLRGHHTMKGIDIHGTHWAWLDTNKPDFNKFYEENVGQNARIVVLLAKEEQMELALFGNRYADAYMQMDAADRFMQLQPTLRRLQHIPYNELRARLDKTGFSAFASSGSPARWDALPHISFDNPVLMRAMIAKGKRVFRKTKRKNTKGAEMVTSPNVRISPKSM